VEKPSEPTRETSTMGESSAVLVDSQQSGLETAWERAMEKQA
jgi:hypothetical protein